MKLGCQARSYGKGIYPNEADFLSVVRQIGNLCFRGLEANWKNLERYFQDPEAFKRILSETNLELIGAHYGAAHWDESSREQIRTEGDQIADFVSAVGGQYIVCSGRRPTQGTVSDEMWQKTAEGLNLLGEHCVPKGVQLAYHNHWWESEQEGLSNWHHIPNRHTWDSPLTPDTTYGRAKTQSHWSENSQTGYTSSTLQTIQKMPRAMPLDRNWAQAY